MGSLLSSSTGQAVPSIAVLIDVLRGVFMPMRAMCFSGVRRSDCVTTHGVFPRSNDFKMFWPDAYAILAQMIDLHPTGDSSDRHFVHKSVSVYQNAFSGSGTDLELPVASTLDFPTPDPAPVRVDGNMAHKSCQRFFWGTPKNRYSSHSKTPFSNRIIHPMIYSRKSEV